MQHNPFEPRAAVIIDTFHLSICSNAAILLNVVFSTISSLLIYKTPVLSHTGFGLYSIEWILPFSNHSLVRPKETALLKPRDLFYRNKHVGWLVLEGTACI